MILIAVSGSTKCDWELLENQKKVYSFSTKGINPFFHEEGVIETHIKQNKKVMEKADDIKALFFYGAGCSSKSRKAIVERALKSLFPRSHLLVSHDIVAAALACYQGVPAISCILGTGSNSCFFDGDIVREEVPALDYILGNEGGGSYFGKKLLKFYLYKQLPDDLHTLFEEKYSLTADEILENIYMQPFANVYLASFMKFYQDNKKHEFINKILHQGISEFMDLHVCCFKSYKEYETNFVGSIAYYFKDILMEEANKKGIVVGKILKEPVKDLVNYYVKNYHQKLPA